MKTTWVFGVLSLILSMPSITSSQSSRITTGTPRTAASVEGHVLCSDGGAPARHAIVRLHLLSRLLPQNPNTPEDRTENPHEASTDFTGYYRFPAVAPGVYVVSVKQDGYNDNYEIATSILDRFDPDEQKKILGAFPQIAVAGSGALQQDIVIARGASISGRVTLDTGGIPGHYQIEAQLLSTSLFGNTTDRDSQHPAPNFSILATTDDRGYYRVAGLPAGTYRVHLHMMENENNVEAYGSGVNLNVYAPEALEAAEASVIKAGDGEEINDVDINIPTRLLHSISGTITQAGAPVAKAYIRIFRQDEKEPCECGTVTSSEGNYSLRLLRPSAYTLTISLPSRSLHPTKPYKLTVLVENNDVTGANLDIPNR